MKDYRNVPIKRAVQRIVFSEKMKPNVVALGGPNQDIYTDMVKEFGAKCLDLYENDPDVIRRQKFDLSLPYDTYEKDIINAKLEPDTMYDLDFCSSIWGKEPYIQKFPNAIFTFCSRGVGVINTIHMFLKALGEAYWKMERGNFIDHMREYRIYAGKGMYKAIHYLETSQMVTIFKQ